MQPCEGGWRVAVDALKETEKVLNRDTHVPKILVSVALNYSLYWTGMATTLVAGQSFSLWTDDDQEEWSTAWVRSRRYSQFQWC